MDINRLRQFATLVATANLRKSAELLGMSPGALSKSIKILQQEVGHTLVEASGRGLRITQTGMNFFENSKPVLAEFDLFQEKVGQLGSAKVTPPIRLATFELFSTYVFSKLTQKFDSKTRFTLLEKAPGEIEKCILAKEADFGITTQPIPNSHLDFMRLCSFKSGIFVCGPKSNPKDFSELVFSSPLTPIPTNPAGTNQLDGWPAGTPRILAYRVELLETGLALARLGRAAIFCPVFIAQLHNQVVKSELQIKEISPPKNFKHAPGGVYFVKRKNDPESPLVKKLTTQIRLLCKD